MYGAVSITTRSICSRTSEDTHTIKNDVLSYPAGTYVNAVLTSSARTNVSLPDYTGTRASSSLHVENRLSRVRTLHLVTSIELRCDGFIKIKKIKNLYTAGILSLMKTTVKSQNLNQIHSLSSHQALSEKYE